MEGSSTYRKFVVEDPVVVSKVSEHVDVEMSVATSKNTTSKNKVKAIEVVIGRGSIL
jgi:hypothetical protein